MKNIIKPATLTAILLYLSFTVIIAQSNFHISGVVTDSANGNPIINHAVYAYIDSAQPATGFVYSDYTLTDTTGAYSFVVPGGSDIGQNLNFHVTIFDCNSMPQTHSVQNHQGTVSSAIVDFNICHGSQGGGGNSCIDHSLIDLNMYCTMIYAPVCGCDGHTYDNECIATYGHGITHFTQGVCGSSPCSADFVSSLYSNGEVHFHYTGSSNVNHWNWDFGDGHASTQQSPIHQYISPGTFTVCLTITDANGCTDTNCETIVVGQATNCHASFTHSNVSGNLLDIQFNASGSNNTTTTWHWDFGDGHGSNQQNPLHQYTSSGMYLVCLTISDNHGCTDTNCQHVYLGHANCVDSTIIDMNTGCNMIYDPVCGCDGVTYGNSCAATFYHGVISYTQGPCGSSGTCYASYTYTHAVSGVQFHGTGNNNPAASPVIAWYWDFGDGHTSTDQNPHHQFTQTGIGTYTVCLTIADAAGCTVTYCDTIHVGNTSPNCQAIFTYQYMNSTNLGLAFSGISNINSAVWHWDFGDGHSATIQDPVHHYNSAGTYLVCLTISTLGCVDTYCEHVIVSAGSGYSISGIVYHTNTLAVHSKVYLIQMLGLTGHQKVDSTYTTTAGAYIFNHVTPGKYMVKAEFAPNTTGNLFLAPTYHYSSLYWQHADIAEVVNSNLYHIDIFMISGGNLNGPGSITGNISWAGGLKLASGSDAELDGVTVLLLDMYDEMLTFTYSENGGNFNFENIPYGTYKVYAEWLGKDTEPAIVTISQDVLSVGDVQIFVSETVFSDPTGINEKIFSESITLYPNPANDFVFVKIEQLQSEDFELNVYDILGKKIAENSFVTCSFDDCVFELNISQFSPGIYFIEIKTNSGSDREKLIVTVK